MVEHAIPFQIDLFTGVPVDTRTSVQKKAALERQQPQQIEMFSQRATAQFGVRSRPVMPFSPGKLVLLSEDVRSEEEIERDLMHQAQANTADLFATPPATIPTSDHVSDLPAQPPREGIPPELVDAPTGLPLLPEEDNDDPVIVSADLPPSKYAAYRALVSAAEERAGTLYATPVSALSESISMNLAKLDARRAGLTGSEMEAALQIGAYRGRATQAQQPITQETKLAAEIPILWTTKADMLKRRPDLAPLLERLREDEVEALAGLVGQALQEFYWIQLNVVLSLYLDHDLHLTRTVPKQRKPEITSP